MKTQVVLLNISKCKGKYVNLDFIETESKNSINISGLKLPEYCHVGKTYTITIDKLENFKNKATITRGLKIDSIGLNDFSENTLKGNGLAGYSAMSDSKESKVYTSVAFVTKDDEFNYNDELAISIELV